jgi:hypothetical protein
MELDEDTGPISRVRVNTAGVSQSSPGRGRVKAENLSTGNHGYTWTGHGSTLGLSPGSRVRMQVVHCLVSLVCLAFRLCTTIRTRKETER